MSNILRRFRAAVQLLKIAELAGLTTRQKSSLYRSSNLLYSSIVESLAYLLVKKQSPYPHVIGQSVSYKEKYKLPSSSIGTKTDLYICEKIVTPQLINDKDIGLGKLILYLKNRKIIDDTEYKNLDWARRERNKIHIQSLTSTDTGYTKKKVNKLGELINLLLDKLEESS